MYKYIREIGIDFRTLDLRSLAHPLEIPSEEVLHILDFSISAVDYNTFTDTLNFIRLMSIYHRFHWRVSEADVS